MVKQSVGVKEPTEYALDKFIATYEKRLWIYNQHGGVEPNRLYGVIYYAAEKLGCKHFIIDSLMRVVPGEDSYNEQKDFVVKLCEIASEANIHIHFVHHVRGGDESKPAGRYDAKGSKAISDNVHNAINVWSQKDKESDQDKPDVILTCDKQREGEWEGSIALWFVPECMQFCGTQDRSVRQWLKL
jgi:twinkle protein